MRATYCGLMSEVDDQLGRVFDYLKQTGQWDDTLDRLHLRPRRAAGRPSPAGQDRLHRRVLSHPDDRPRPARPRPTARAAASSSASPRPSTPCRPSSNGWACRLPRQCDGRSLLGFCEGQAPGDWRDRGALRVRLPRHLLQQARNRAGRGDGQELAGGRAGREVQVCSISRALPPLPVRPREGSRASSSMSPAIPPMPRSSPRYSAKMLNWRLGFADRTLTGYRATPNGLEAEGRLAFATVRRLRSRHLLHANVKARVRRGRTLVTARTLWNFTEAFPKWTRRVNMSRCQPFAWFMLVATLVAFRPALALETMPGEPPFFDGKAEPVSEQLRPPTTCRWPAVVVIAVDRAAKRVTLQYRPIPHLFLDGGTRIFPVGDGASLKGLGPWRQGPFRGRAQRAIRSRDCRTATSESDFPCHSARNRGDLMPVASGDEVLRYAQDDMIRLG